MAKNKFYRSGIGSSCFRNGATTAKLVNNQIRKNTVVIKNTYNLTLISSSTRRNKIMVDFYKFCAENNCKGKITIQTKWWIVDKYLISIEGQPKDVNRIADELNNSIKQ